MRFFDKRIAELTDERRKTENLFLAVENEESEKPFEEFRGYVFDVRNYLSDKIAILDAQIEFLKRIRENIPDCAGDVSIRMLVNHARRFVHELSEISTDSGDNFEQCMQARKKFVIKVQLKECYFLLGEMIAAR